MALHKPGIYITLITAVCLAAIVVLLDRISVNQSSTLEQMLTGEDKALLSRLKATFDIDSEVVLLAIDLNAKSEKHTLDAIEQALLALQMVESVVPVPSGLYERNAPPERTSRDGRNTNVRLLLLGPGTAQLEVARNLSQAIRAAVEGLLSDGESAHIVGLPQIREASWEIGERDTRLMLPLLIAATLLVTRLCFKSYMAIGLSLLLTSLTTSVCLVLQLLLRAEMNALVVLVVPIIWTVATLDAFHLYSRTAIHARRKHADPARSAGRELFFPCLLTTVTTAGCFLTLTLLDTSPLIVSFGVWCTAGTILAFVFTFTVGIALLSLHRPADDAPRWPAAMAFLLVRFAQRRCVTVVVTWAIVAVVAAIAIPRIEVATAFPQVFSSGTPMAQSIEHLQRLTGSDLNPIELVIEPTDPHGRQLKRLGSAALFTSNYLKTIDETNAVLPIGILEEDTLEDIVAQWSGDEDVSVSEQQLADTGLRYWLNTREPAARLQVFMQQSTYARKQEILEWIENFDDTMLEHHALSLSGSGYLYHLTEQRGLRSLLFSSVLSLLILGATLAWLVRSPVQLAIALCGSLVPATILAGGMAASAIPWTIALLPMPVLLLGLMNDDTIHISWRDQDRGRLRGGDYLRNAVSAGPALLATTLLLSAAIATLAFSGIATNQYLGVLIPLGLVLALMCNLTLLPALNSCLRRLPRSTG